MRSTMLRVYLEMVGVCWLCIEIGQFFEERTPFGGLDLFWLLWVAVFVILLMAVYIADQHRTP